MIVVRTLTADDWREWRELRLEALREAPYAFHSRFEDWAGVDERRWRQRLDEVPLNILADLDGKPAGMACGTAPDPDGTSDLLSVWVAPFARGRGVGDTLVASVVGWAREQGAVRVRLAVFESNHNASVLYRRQGFVDTMLLGEELAMEREF
ncbi:MAG TPA: GNAT family N-acetyltransferase [Amycolatopsis sp.]|uniref:GNAT family N-acetyltransferase n=1 Tax=Amycolatopsis sp. TaxID=37632 RepID=UPI002B45D05D|nr:GNAT family N-acetyltransferase [Amycolatopsis sp.]HKS43803.1 GNAT family N-acetyltransferase [Amycolatopsis sp.]